MATTAATVSEIVPLESQRAAGAALARAIRERHTFLALTGECDVGKTVVLDAALAVVTDEALRLIMVGNPRSGPLTLTSVLQQIAQYAPPPSAAAEEGDVERIHAMLQAADHKRFLIVVEDAESLHPKALSFLQVLPELAGLTSGGVQIVLVGSPDLWRLVDGESFARLREQLAVRIVVEPLSGAEARYFAAWRCRERLERFGPEGAGSAMVDALVRYGLGRPGRIDALIDRISLLAPSRGGADASLVAEAAEMLGGFSAVPTIPAAPALAAAEPAAPEPVDTGRPSAAVAARPRWRPALIVGVVVAAGVAGWLSYGRLDVPWMPRSTGSGIIGRRASASAAPRDAPGANVPSVPPAAMPSHGPNPRVTRQASAVGVEPAPPPPPAPQPPAAPRVAPNSVTPNVPETSGVSTAPEPQGAPQPAETRAGSNSPTQGGGGSPAAGTAPAPQAGVATAGPSQPASEALPPPPAPASTSTTPPAALEPAVTTPGATKAPRSTPPAPKPAGAALAHLRKDFDAFLAKAGTDTASLTEPQKRALFEQYLAWRSRTKSKAPTTRAPASAAR